MAWLVAGCALLGMLAGSFFNVVVHRLPRMLAARWEDDWAAWQGQPKPARPAYNLSRPRSACPACGRPIAARDNVPLLSWLWLRGACRHCRTPISWRYPLLELVSALLAGGLAWRFGATPQLLAALVLAGFLLRLAWIDLETRLLPDCLTLPLVWLGLGFSSLDVTGVPLHEALWGAMAGYVLLWSVAWLFLRLTGREGMGQGDVKLLAALGAWLGLAAVPDVIVLAAGAAVVVGLAGRLFGRLPADAALPFGPFLATAGMVVLWVTG